LTIDAKWKIPAQSADITAATSPGSAMFPTAASTLLSARSSRAGSTASRMTIFSRCEASWVLSGRWSRLRRALTTIVPRNPAPPVTTSLTPAPPARRDGSRWHRRWSPVGRRRGARADGYDVNTEQVGHGHDLGGAVAGAERPVMGGGRGGPTVAPL